MGNAAGFVMYVVLVLVVGGCWRKPSGGQSPPQPSAPQVRLSPVDQAAVTGVLSGSAEDLGPLLAPDQKPGVVLAALSRAGEDDAAAVDVLLTSPTQSALVRANALAALVRMQGAEAGASLARHLDLQVVDLVGTLGGPDDLPLLDLAAGSDDPVLRAHAVAARQQVEGR